MKNIFTFSNNEVRAKDSNFQYEMLGEMGKSEFGFGLQKNRYAPTVKVRWQDWKAETEDDGCVLIELFGTIYHSSEAVRACFAKSLRKRSCFFAILQEIVRTVL